MGGTFAFTPVDGLTVDFSACFCFALVDLPEVGLPDTEDFTALAGEDLLPEAGLVALADGFFFGSFWDFKPGLTGLFLLVVAFSLLT